MEIQTTTTRYIISERSFDRCCCQIYNISFGIPVSCGIRCRCLQVSSGSRATHAADYIDVTLVKQAVALQYLVISGLLLTNRYQ